MSLQIEELAAEPSLDLLSGPYYVAWWITNRCNLLCVHCINDSGPYHSFEDELATHEIERVSEQLVEAGVSQMALTGGEPMIHKDFFRVAGYLCDHGIALNVETDGQLINREVAKKLARLGLRSVQVSVDGATQETYGLMRRTVTGSADLSRTLGAITLLASEGAYVAVNFAPTRFSIHEVGTLIDMLAGLGVKRFYTGRLIRVGRAAYNWKWLNPTEEQYRSFFETLQRKAGEYAGKLKIIYYPYTVAYELGFRLANPAASFVILPNGKIKMMGAMPFLCADLRRHGLREAWERYKLAWKVPAVAEFINRVQRDDSLLATNNQFVELNLEPTTIRAQV